MTIAGRKLTARAYAVGAAVIVGAGLLGVVVAGHTASQAPVSAGRTSAPTTPVRRKKQKHAPAPPVVAASQRLVALVSKREVFAGPASDARRLGPVRATRPYTRERTTLPVLGTSVAASGRVWLHVELPGRPNGHSGWIMQKGTVAASTSWHIVVDLSQRRVTVYRHGHVVRTARAVVGKPSTPTPRGSFFVEETIQLAPTEVGAPDALALSARSDVLRTFDGGPGQIGLHGLKNVGGVPGTAVSHGCVRLSTSMMRWLAHRMGPGTPVTILA
jgi:lipoprotein-anchoring transpeptidase ErfK/SrfK